MKAISAQLLMGMSTSALLIAEDLYKDLLRSALRNKIKPYLDLILHLSAYFSQQGSRRWSFSFKMQFPVPVYAIVFLAGTIYAVLGGFVE